MSNRYVLTSSKKLLKKAKNIVLGNIGKLSNKALLKIVNRHNTSKKLKGIFERLGKRTTFTNSEIDDAIKLQGLSSNELKKLAKNRVIKNINRLTEDQLYYALISSNKSPLEDNFI